VNRLQQLRDELNHKARCLQDLKDKTDKENRQFTAEEIKVWDKTEAELKSLKEEIESVKAHIERVAKLEEFKQELSNTSTAPVRGQPENGNPATPPNFATPKRHGALRSFKGPDADQKAYRSGVWARAVLYGDQSARVRGEAMGLFDNHLRNALSEGTDSAGGVLVPEEFSQAIIDLRESYGVFRQQCQVVPMGSDTLTVPRRAGGVTAYFVGEGSTITDSDPSWNQVRLTDKKLGALTKLSSEVASDAFISLADWLANEMAYAFALKEDQCGFTGDGTSTYGGITGLGAIFVASSSLTGAVDAASGHDTFAEIDASDLALLMAKLPEYARMNAKWYCSAVAMDMVFGRLMAAAGGNTIQNMMGGYGRSYMGYPIVVSQVLPTSTGDLSDVPMLYFGDLAKAATMGDRRGISVFPSDHRYMELDQVAVRATERFDINVHDYGTTSAAGPIVALVGE
jgi:HK97 family phage major capsid protein